MAVNINCTISEEELKNKLKKLSNKELCNINNILQNWYNIASTDLDVFEEFLRLDYFNKILKHTLLYTKFYHKYDDIIIIKDEIYFDIIEKEELIEKIIKFKTGKICLYLKNIQ